MSSREEAIRKVLKCLALSKSQNEHEAALALRQAQGLMAKHGIEQLDVLAAQACEQAAKSRAQAQPAAWENRLAQMTARAFSCRLVFQTGSWRRKGDWLFIGCGPSPEIARYAFEVLLRQAHAARTEYIKTALRRCKPATRTARADLFCDAWVDGVASKVSSLVPTSSQSAAIEAYMTRRFSSLDDLACTNRNDGLRLRDWHHLDLATGRLQGRQARLAHGVNGTDPSIKRLPT